MSDEPRCEGTFGRFHLSHCPNRGRFAHKGKRYCKMHHPPTVDAKRKARHAEWDRRWEAAEKLREAAEQEQKRMERYANLGRELATKVLECKATSPYMKDLQERARKIISD